MTADHRASGAPLPVPLPPRVGERMGVGGGPLLGPRLWGIGVGPGDPELLTVKGLRLLQAAEVVFLPVRRAGGRSYAGEIVAEYLAPARQEIVPLVYPARRDTAAPERQWARNADLIADALAPDRLGVFLTEGDPLLYSTFVHALLPLRARHPHVRIGVVPGVWSGSAAAAALAEPLVDGPERLAVLPGLYNLADLRAVLERFDTVVLLKPGRDLAALRAAIAACGASAVWVRRVGRPEQAIVRDLAALPAARPDYFSLLIVRRQRTADARNAPHAPCDRATSDAESCEGDEPS